MGNRFKQIKALSAGTEEPLNVNSPNDENGNDTSSIANSEEKSITKQKTRKRSVTEQKARYWRAIFYTESLPADWEKKLTEEENVRWACSPLHDKDLYTEDDEKENPNNKAGTTKKPHYHIVFYFSGKKSFSQVKELCARFHQQIPKVCNSPSGAVQYFIHQHDKDKYQYSAAEIRGFNGFPVQTLLEEMNEERDRALMIAVEEFIDNNKVKELRRLAQKLRVNTNLELYDYFRKHYGYFRDYIASYRNEEKDNGTDGRSNSVSTLADAAVEPPDIF